MIYAMGILLAGVTVLWVLLPLLTGTEAPMGAEDLEQGERQHRKRMALLSLRDVEYDYLSGKLDDDDYQTMKAQISGEALAALEDEARQTRKPQESAALEAEIEALRQSLREGLVCAQCAHPNPRGARFCASCGAALPEPSRAG
jgi:hypothetical protein